MLEAEKNHYPASAFVQALEVRPIVSVAALKGQDEALAQRLGVALPRAPRRVEAGGMSYLWSGPGMWLAIGPAAPELAARTAGMAAVTEQSDGLSLFKVHGPCARAILAKLVPVDVHESAFAADAVALSIAAHIGIRLWREEDGFVLGCFRGFAGALHHALGEAAAEFAAAG